MVNNEITKYDSAVLKQRNEVEIEQKYVKTHVAEGWHGQRHVVCEVSILEFLGKFIVLARIV